MKHDPTITGSALAIVGGGLYLLCALWVLLARPSYMWTMGTWMHGVNLSALPTRSLDLTTLLIGFVTFTALSWVAGYAFATIYNKLAKK